MGGALFSLLCVNASIDLKIAVGMWSFTLKLGSPMSVYSSDLVTEFSGSLNERFSSNRSANNGTIYIHCYRKQ